MRVEPKVPRLDSQRNREAVIDAALELLARQPTASMAAIAASSGVGRTTVYRHFPTRDNLVRALFGRVVAEARAATSAVIARPLTTREILYELGPAIAAIGHRFQFLDGMRRPRGDEVIAESTLDPDDPVRRFLTAAKDRGEIHPELPVQWMCSSINNLALATMIELAAGRIDAEQAGRLLGDTFVRSFAL